MHGFEKEINVQQTHGHTKQLVNTDWEMSQNVRTDLPFKTPATFVLTLLHSSFCLEKIA